MKKDILIKIAFFLIIFFAFITFFKFHLVSDAYRIIDSSNGYMISLKLIEGRPIQSFYFILLSIFKININSVEMYMLLYRINLFIAITILSFSANIMYNKLSVYMKSEKMLSKLFLALIILTVFINISICEYMLFIENFIIALGILFSIIASLVFSSDIKYRMLYSVVLIFISSICYQGVAQFFVIFSFILVLIKCKDMSRKDIFSVVLKILLVYLLAQGLNYLMTFTFNLYLPKLDPRLFNGIINNLDKILTYDNKKIIIIYMLIFSSVILTNIKVLYNQNFEQNIINLVIIVVLSIISFFIFLFNNSCGLMPRTVFNFIIIYPMLMIYILSIKGDQKLILNLIFILALLLSNIIFVVKLENYNIDSTVKNIEVVSNIIERINDYEESNNLSVENIAFCDDNSLNYKYWNAYTTVYSTYNNPIYYGYWCDINSINVLSNRKFNKVDNKYFDLKNYNYFKIKNWDTLNLNEQIIFDGNIAIICRF